MKKSLFLFSILLPFLFGGAVFAVDPPQSDPVSDEADSENELEKIMRKAEEGDAKSQHELGFIYSYGLAFPVNFELANKWVTLSAEQGYAAAQVMLGGMHEHGRAAPKDYAAAIHWYTLAANQEYAAGQGALGEMHAKGKGVPQNHKVGAKWYMLGAKQGNGRAQFYLGMAYAKGEGVPQDYILSYMWSDIAATNKARSAPKIRDRAAKKMSSADIAKAQKLARECVESNYQAC